MTPTFRFARLAAVSLAATVFGSAPVFATTYYASPTGSDGATGQTQSTPWKTFAKAFATMHAGDELVLLDGTYSAAAGTGGITYVGTSSAQVPSGTSVSAMTTVRALNPGLVTLVDNLFVGRSTRKDSFIRFQGLKMTGGATIYNTDHIMVKECSVTSTTQGAGAVFVIGSNDHDNGNTYVTVEDSWVYGKERIVVIVFRADHVVLRRVVGRQDGCYSSAGCGENSGNYMVGMTVYNSSDVSFQNVLMLDSIIGPNGFGGAADFQTAWHDNADGSFSSHPFGRNQWLGSITLNSSLGGFMAEADVNPALKPTWTFNNIVGWGSAAGAFNADLSGASNAFEVDLDNGTFSRSSGSGTDIVRVSGHLGGGTGRVRNVIATGVGRSGINSAITPSYSDVYAAGLSNGAFDQTTCSVGCKSTNPQSDGATPSLKYLTRTETGSALKGTGFGGGDYGANVSTRYGVDGSFHGDAGYNTLTAIALWPWPNEARIKQDMCAAAGVTRGFCGTASVTSYVWGYLGSAYPGGGSAAPSAPTNVRIIGQ